MLEPGMHTTVQDLGRPGRSALGVPVGGAADTLSLRAGNRLLGNPEGSAGLEMTMIGGSFEFDADALVAVVGGGPDVTLGDGPAAVGEALAVRKGQTLRVGRLKLSVRSYLCVRGGLAVPRVLGSSSTLVTSGFGGHQGRILRAGDVLAVGPEPAAPPLAGLGQPWRLVLDAARDRRTLRAVAGPHEGTFAEAKRFWAGEFTVTPRSDRAGVRLAGEAMVSTTAGRMTSEGMMWGAVQAPEGGQPIILMPDGPTTGGYPVLAVIAAVDLPTLGQLPPLSKIRFQRTEAEHARQAWSLREHTLTQEER